MNSVTNGSKPRVLTSVPQYTKKEPKAKGGKRFFTMKSYHAHLYKTVTELTCKNIWMSQE